MEHTFKYLGSKESMKNLWQNEESLNMYIERLKEFWDEENECWLEKPKEKMNTPTSIDRLKVAAQKQKSHPVG